MKIFKKKHNLPQNTHGTHDTNSIPFRLNFLFVIVFLLFAALIIQLAHLQIIDGKKYAYEAANSNMQTETKNVPRGMIYDSSGKLLVSNNATTAITYTKPLSVTSNQMYQVANNLVNYITVDTSQLTDNMKEAYYLGNTENEEKVQKHIKDANSVTGSKLYDEELEYVEKHNLASDLSPKQQQAAVLYNKMNSAYSLSTIMLKSSDVSDVEMAQVGAHLSDLPGVKIGTNWTRDYPNGESIKSIVGTVTTEKQGLPSDQINSLLAKGYSRNDSIGSSYIESQYEDILKGDKEVIKVETQNNKIKKEIKQYGGSSGDDIQLTINAKFQEEVQNIIKNLENSVASSNPYVPGAYAVVMNPNTGAVYALAGVSRDVKTGKVTDNAIGAINQTYVMGSVVKGAMVMGALEEGVITPTNNTLEEQPIKLAGTADKTSWFNKNGSANMPLTAQEALEVSSNTYMMQLVLKEAGLTYHSGMSLSGMSTSIFDKMRNNFKQYGLGVKTGIDIPGESAGFEGPSTKSDIGKALDLSFGNYDSYTTLQLAQYISTIANGGYRLQPHVLDSVHKSGSNGKMGQTLYQFMPNVLNVVSGTSAEWNVVKTGLYDVVHGNNQYITGKYLADVKPEVAAKTGTAQTYYGNTETETLSAVSYAPYNNPQVAIAVAFPGMAADTKNKVNLQAVEQIYSAYWKYVQSSDGFK
ncbi:peptidoglycan D,D-transpeptidase FtsI family protein [Ligilactobacillus cholophilus]|uniref:peptidoglycan D,D-transpeptidase FtsI family protein n=1 Tax=Ligilactobacillus cholophilus TaxID=3050131 RepID=UPI003EBDED6F